MRTVIVTSNSFSFQFELLYRMHVTGMKIKEIPIIFYERSIGKAKMDQKTFFEALWKVFSTEAPTPAWKALKADHSPLPHQHVENYKNTTPCSQK